MLALPPAFRRLDLRRLICSVLLDLADMHVHLAAEGQGLVDRIEGHRVGPDRSVRQVESNGLVGADDLALGVEAGEGELAGEAGTRGDANVVLHDEPFVAAVEESAHSFQA